MFLYHYNHLRPVLLSLAFILTVQAVHAQTKIGGTAGPGDASAVLELQSANQGLLLPRLTTTQRNAISNPATGLTIYNTTDHCLQVYKGAGNGGWHNFCSSGGGALAFTNCSTPVITGTIAAQTATTATIQLNYTNNTGQTHGAFVSGTVNGITLTASGGGVTAITAGSGSITLTASGTPASAGNINIPVVLAGAACNIPITVDAFQGNVPVACGTAPGCTGGVNPATAVAGDKICWGGFEYMVITATGGKLWFDRNLGASRVPTSETDASGLGDLYQWGRTGDGHQCRNSQNAAGPLTVANLPAATGKFITNNTSPYDWLTPQNGTLWGNTSSGGDNNPCPSGWRVPTITEINTALTGQNPWTSVLKAPQSGYRAYNTGTVDGGAGGLRAADVSGALAYILQWSSGNVINTSHQNPNSARAWGWPVRCVKH